MTKKCPFNPYGHGILTACIRDECMAWHELCDLVICDCDMCVYPEYGGIPEDCKGRNGFCKLIDGA